MKRRKRRQRTPERMRKRANRRYRLFSAIGRVLFLGILLGAAVLAMTIFFKLDTVRVEGLTKYSEEEIVAGMDIQKGDNLYLWNKMKTAESMVKQFPYLKTVQIRRHLPSSLVVTVTECKAVMAVPTNGVFYLFSEQGKVLEQVATDQGLPIVTGVALMDVKPGDMLYTSTDAGVDALLQVLHILTKAEMLANVDFVNMQSLMDVHIGYQKRFDIQVGALEQMEYRLRFAQTVIEQRLSPSDVGRLYWDAKNRMHFVPDTAENVAKAGIGEEEDNSPVVSPEDLANITENGSKHSEASSGETEDNEKTDDQEQENDDEDTE